MKKQTSNAFNKKIYLLGFDKDGVYYWLEAPKWDFGWYWGFGYIENYTNNKHPHLAKNISSHQHADGEYKVEDKSDTNLFTGNFLVDKTFSEEEGWELRELFSQFYHLKEQTGFWGRGKMNIADTEIENWKNEDLKDKINKKMLPIIMGRIIKILGTKLID